MMTPDRASFAEGSSTGSFLGEMVLFDIDEELVIGLTRGVECVCAFRGTVRVGVVREAEDKTVSEFGTHCARGVKYSCVDI